MKYSNHNIMTSFSDINEECTELCSIPKERLRDRVVAYREEFSNVKAHVRSSVIALIVGSWIYFVISDQSQIFISFFTPYFVSFV